MLEQLLHQHRGLVRTSTLREHGVSGYALQKELGAGTLRRVRRGWVARPDADPELVDAVRAGLMLSCLTLAHRLGLWVRDPTTSHYAVPRPGAERRPAGAVLHYRRPAVPREPFALHDSLENALLLVAHCQPFEEAVAIWDSALNRRLLDRRALERLPLTRTARLVLESTSPFADSGLESYARVRLRWLRIRIIPQAVILGRRVDLLLGERLVLQIDGGHHVGAQRTADIEHDAMLRLHGYTVIRVGYEQIVHRWPEVQQLVMQAVAQGLHDG